MSRIILLVALVALSGMGLGCRRSDPPAIDKVFLTGTVDLDPALKTKADPLAVLFIIARSPEGEIAAVKKIFPPLEFPLNFQLTFEDQMIPGRPLPKRLRLKVRLDRDGNANADQSGDIVGYSGKDGVPLGNQLVVQLDRLVK
jgi:hypothetical protein